MRYTHIDSAKSISLEIGWVKIQFITDNWKVHFTKKELSKIYDVSKDYVKSEFESIAYKKVIVWGQRKKYYSIDSVIVLGYKLGKFKETKTLILLNRYMKMWGSSETLLTRMKKLYNEIWKYSFS